MSDIRGPQDKSGTWDIVGTPESDSLYGGKGSNHYDGGAGEDTVFYGGYSEQIEVKFDAASQSYKIGGDTLKNVEYIQFNDVRMKVEDAAAMERPQYHYAEDGRQLQAIGTDSDNSLSGTNGDDTFTGRGGNDGLYGGKGEDTAIFSGNRADYDIRFDYNTNLYVVTDHQAGRDGKDTLWQIEHLKFADTTIDLHALNGLSGPPDEATVAKLDGVIEALPAPDHSEWIGFGDTGGVIDSVGLITIDVIGMDSLFTTANTVTSIATIGAAVEPIALAGVPATFSFAGASGFTLEAP